MRHLAILLLTTAAAEMRLLRTISRAFGSRAKPRCVFLNAARLDFDSRIDYSKLEALADVTKHDATAPEDVAAAAKGATIVVNKEMPLDATTIAALPASVKLLCEAGTGYNNIDLKACAARGLEVANVPTYASDAMAHMAITQIMALACSLWPQAQALARGDTTYLQQSHLGQLTHMELTGKTLGLIGGGTIGGRVAAIARCLGMEVVVADPSGKAPEGCELVELDALLARSDFVSVQCPLNEHTKGLVGAAELARMKPTAYLVNTARGSIVDLDALVEALKARRIAGAALDVFGEGSAPPPALPADHPLYALDNVILTPHIGWQRAESRQRVVDMVADSVAAHLAGELPNIDLATGRPRV